MLGMLHSTTLATDGTQTSVSARRNHVNKDLSIRRFLALVLDLQMDPLIFRISSLGRLDSL